MMRAPVSYLQLFVTEGAGGRYFGGKTTEPSILQAIRPAPINQYSCLASNPSQSLPRANLSNCNQSTSSPTA